MTDSNADIPDFAVPGYSEKHVVMITGSRKFPNPNFVRLMVRLIKESGAEKMLVGYDPKMKTPKGVDELAYFEALSCGLPVVTYPAKWVTRGQPVDKQAGFKRNLEMVRDCTRCLAIWDESSPGTAHAIVAAHQANKLFRIYGATDKSPEELLRMAYARRKIPFPEPENLPESEGV